MRVCLFISELIYFAFRKIFDTNIRKIFDTNIITDDSFKFGGKMVKSAHCAKG